NAAWTEPIAEVLKNLGSVHAWVVHGSDGLDEITTTGPTAIVALENGTVRRFTITPEEVGIARAKPADLKGADPDGNARALRAVLDGARTAYRDIAVLNAAAALVVAEEATDLRDGVARAARSIETGAAKAVLDKLVAVSNTCPNP
ncbi:MAG TPA: anthranilate phosphoribosyltransferase, partial [Beijerinckiaceae bacterium]|nr:anthranilate phosphoribosyltransferase [Beijerinckiaceae bacterium]